MLCGSLGTQLVTTVESADQVNDLTVLSVNTASAALSVSNIPWEGPVGCVRVSRILSSVMIPFPVSSRGLLTLWPPLREPPAGRLD